MVVTPAQERVECHSEEVVLGRLGLCEKCPDVQDV